MTSSHQPRDNRHPFKLYSRCVMTALMFAATLPVWALTPLVPLSPQIVNPPANIPGGNFGISNLFDGKIKTEYASADAGTNTVAHLLFDQPSKITALRHFDRND